MTKWYNKLGMVLFLTPVAILPFAVICWNGCSLSSLMFDLLMIAAPAAYIVLALWLVEKE
jgi:hypothetical protein